MKVTVFFVPFFDFLVLSGLLSPLMYRISKKKGIRPTSYKV